MDLAKRASMVHQCAAQRVIPKGVRATTRRLFVNGCAARGVNWQRHPGRHGTLTGETRFCREEDHPSLSSKLLIGPGKRCCARGGLMGSFHEALHGEAPQGQPRNHRRQRKQPSQRPMGGKEWEKRSVRRRKAPPSSRWTKKERKKIGSPLEG